MQTKGIAPQDERKPRPFIFTDWTGAKLLKQYKVIKTFPIMKTFQTIEAAANLKGMAVEEAAKELTERAAAALYLANIYIGEL